MECIWRIKCREYVGVDFTPENVELFSTKIKDAGLKNVSAQVGDATSLVNIMALEGWEIHEIDEKECIFGKIEPKRLKYSVVYFKRSHKTDAQEAEFIKDCDAQGWKYVDYYKNIYVFKGKTDFPTPIKVDRREQRREIIRRYLLQNLFFWILALALGIKNFYEVGLGKALVDYVYLVLAVLIFLPVIAVIIDLINFIRWCIMSPDRFSGGSQSGRAPNLGRYPKLKNAFWA